MRPRLGTGFAAGAVKKDDVPEPKRWWLDVPADEFSTMSKDQLKGHAASLGVEIDMRWSLEKIASTLREAQKTVTV